MKTLKQVKQETQIGDVFTSKDFLSDMESGCICDYDGWGSPHDGEKELEDIDVIPFIYQIAPTMTKKEFCQKYPYIIWYNK